MIIFSLFWLGACMGSFLTCVAVRSLRGQDWVRSRSVCDFCKKPLGPLDLIPIFSFVGSRGKSRCCGKKLPIGYPLSEIVVGLSFALVGMNFFPITGGVAGIQALLVFIIISLLWIMFISDLLYEIIPFDVVLLCAGVSIVFVLLYSPSCTSLSLLPCVMSLLPRFFSGLVPAILFFFLWFFSKGKAMGDGDITLVFLLGFLVGYPSIVVGLYIAFLTGAMTGVILILLQKKSLKSHISFGPFLIGGVAIGAVWGSSIIQFVQSLWF